MQSQTNPNESELENSNSGSGGQPAGTRIQESTGAEDTSNNRELIQQIFYQTQLNSLAQQAPARNENVGNSGVNYRNSPFNWSSAL